MNKKLYVGSLPWSTTAEELKQVLEQGDSDSKGGTQGCGAGAVFKVEIVLHRETGRSRGFAFVEMRSEGDAAKAIKNFNAKDYKGRTLRVAEAGDREDSRHSGPRTRRPNNYYGDSSRYSNPQGSKY